MNAAKTKRVLVLSMAFIILSSAIAFAGAGSETSATGDGITPNAGGVFPITDEPVTMKAFIAKFAQVGEMDANYSTQYIEERTNVQIEWEVADISGAPEKLNIMLSSGEKLPDVILPGPWFLNNNNKYLYGREGVILPLDDYIEEYGHAINELWAHNPALQKQMRSPDGKIYALSSYFEIEHTKYGAKAWINQQWLDNLGLDMPTTTQEFKDTMIRFKNNDPNGNGKADEIPISGSQGGAGLLHLINPFLYMDATRVVVENGTISSQIIKDEFREAVRYIADLYSEGLIDPQIFTQDQTQLITLTMGEDVMLGFCPQDNPFFFVQINSDQERQYQAIPPVKGPGGVQTTAYNAPSARGGNFVVTKDAANPAVAYRWGDFLISDEAQRRIFFGEKGVTWDFGDDGAIGINGQPASIQFIGEPLYNMTVQDYGWLWSSIQIDYLFVDGTQVDANVWNRDTFLYNNARKYLPYIPPLEEVLPPLTLAEEIVEEYNTISTDVVSYYNEAFANFITGNLDVNDDGDWDNYKRELERRGLSKQIQYMQAAYDNQYK